MPLCDRKNKKTQKLIEGAEKALNSVKKTKISNGNFESQLDD